MKKLWSLFCLCFLATCAIGKTTGAPLEQEIGQMIMVGFNGDVLHDNDPIVQDIKHHRIGGVVLFDYNYQTKQFNKNIKNPQQLKHLNKQLQNYNVKAYNHSSNKYSPILIGIDYEGGEVSRLQSQYGFPKTVTAEFLGKQPVSVSKKYAELMAQTMLQEGINLDFAPVVDLSINPNNPIIAGKKRSFSSDPKIVTARAAVFAQTFKQHHILCTLKHFPGHGSSKGDTHLGFVDVTHTWQQQELDPYRDLIKNQQSCDIIMTAHIVNYKLDPKGYPASLSYAMTTKLLREQLGFNGVIITDDLQMGAITDKYSLETTVKLAIQSGADILLFGNQLEYQPNIAKQVIKIIDKLVRNGVISKERIAESYTRIMQMKKLNMGASNDLRSQVKPCQDKTGKNP
ncbi:MAG: glycoside hydrolase family 3 protein [Gammaproteobacteria bacterium]|nr:glycoside hydrolase family 3 protein [Gammaproteobacteria bacterium]